MTRNRLPRYVVSGLGRIVATALLFLNSDAQLAAAQSPLGEVAQRETERRKQVTAGRVYTNADLEPVDAAAPSPAPVASEVAPSAAPEKPATNPGVEPVLASRREKRDEQYWRTLAHDLRARLAKVNADIAAQEARIAEIDAGSQTPTTVREREIISGTLIRLERDVRFLSEGLTRFLTRAQFAKVPEEWIR